MKPKYLGFLGSLGSLRTDARPRAIELVRFAEARRMKKVSGALASADATMKKVSGALASTDATTKKVSGALASTDATMKRE